MFKDIDIVVCSNEQLANEARTGTKLGLTRVVFLLHASAIFKFLKMVSNILILFVLYSCPCISVTYRNPYRWARKRYCMTRPNNTDDTLIQYLLPFC